MFGTEYPETKPDIDCAVGATEPILVTGERSFKEYEGTMLELVVANIKGGFAKLDGSKVVSDTGSITGIKAGSGTGFFFVVFFFGFDPPITMVTSPATAAPQQHSNAVARRSHNQDGKYEPQEPDVAEPELAWEPEESLALEPVFSEAEFKEPLESPEPDDAEESHGVTVVVGVVTGTATGTGTVTGTGNAGGAPAT